MPDALITATTAGVLRRSAERTLRVAGVDAPELDARVLLAEASGVDAAGLIARADLAITPSARATFAAWIARRVAREPVAYIVGHKAFRRIELTVDRRVLIPRPDTETLVAVAKIARPCSILDLATGSGAVALALADELPDATVTAADISLDALDVARANAVRLGLDSRVTFVQSDLLDAIDGRFDCITANLPYVSDAELPGLQPEIVEYEPRMALAGGADGLDLVRRTIARAPARLTAGGMLALEIGAGQAGEVAGLLAAAGLRDVATHRDLAGIERVVTGCR